VTSAAPGGADSVLHIHIDGGCRGNPGEAGFGVHVAGADGVEIAGLYGFIGRATNNVAEYQALLHGLRYALGRGARRVKVYSDSELVVRQISGAYKVKHPSMVPLHREAKELMRRFDEISITHVRREQNKEADALANRALDEKASKLE
jgi:ribonuclease HI